MLSSVINSSLFRELGIVEMSWCLLCLVFDVLGRQLRKQRIKFLMRSSDLTTLTVCKQCCQVNDWFEALDVN